MNNTAQEQESLSEKYRSLFLRTKSLIISPSREWQVIYEEKSDLNKILSGYVLPYIGIIALVTFISYMASHHNYPFESALKHALSQFASLFFGLYIAYFITLNILPKFTLKTSGKDLKTLAFKITAYSSIVLYLVKVLIVLVPQVYYLQIVALYIGYVVWVATKGIGEFESQDLRVVFTVIVSALLLFLPYFISKTFMQFVGF